MTARIDRVIIALMFVFLFLTSAILYFIVQDEFAKVGMLLLIALSSGGFGYSLARIITRR
jgi:hypothetical protein